MAGAPRRPRPPWCCGRLSEQRVPDVGEFIPPIILVHGDLWIEFSNIHRFFHPPAVLNVLSINYANVLKVHDIVLLSAMY